MRLFVALNPEPGARRDWVSAIEPLKTRGWPVRWVAADALHVTLHFLGSVQAERVAAIDNALRDVAARYQPFAMHVRGLGAFPNVQRPRVLWIGVEPDPPLLALQRDVAAALAAIGFAPDARGWSPHITIARVRGDTKPPRGVDDAARSFDYDAVVTIDGIDLTNSVPDRHGARYECVSRARLGSL
jgi:RNA 2',3'-cyclic 3'-phosphodiesterase